MTVPNPPSIMKAQIHEDLTRRADVRPSSDRQFGFVIGVFLVAVGLWPLVRHGRLRIGVVVAGALALLVAAIAPILLRPFNHVWTMLGVLLGRIVNPAVMAVLFYFVFTPIGVLRRIVGKDSLRLRRDAQATSYWIERTPPGPPPETMANQF